MNVDAGYEIYRVNDESSKFYFERSIGGSGIENVATKKNESRQELQTFGKMPYVYYAGDMNYRTFELSTVFTDLEIGDFIQDGISDVIEVTEAKSCREQVDELRGMIMERKPLIVRNTQEQYFVCDVEFVQESSPREHLGGDSLNYIEVSVKCTEIADYFNRLQVKHVGEGAGASAISDENNNTLKGGLGGNEISYFVDVVYGQVLRLFAEATDGYFIRWSVQNATITDVNNFTEYHDGMVLKVEFRKKLNLTIRHTGNGKGHSEVWQEQDKLGEGDGGKGTVYEIQTLGLYPLNLEAEPALGSRLSRWELANGATIYSGYRDYKNGDIIDAVFNQITAKVRVKYLEVGTEKSLQPDDIFYDQYGAVNFSGAIIKDYILQNPKNVTILIKEDIEYLVVFYYEKHATKIVIQHVGSGGGRTIARQNDEIIAEGVGAGGYSYEVEVKPKVPLSLEGVAEGTIGDMETEFIGFYYPDGSEVGENDIFNQGTIIEAKFDIVIDHPYDWLFKLDWDKTLYGDKSVDIDSYTMLHGGELDNALCYFAHRENDENGESRRRVALDFENYVELDTDSRRSNANDLAPEITTVLGLPCDIVSFRFYLWSKSDAMNDSDLDPITIDLFHRVEGENQYVRNYSIPIQQFVTGHRACYVCHIDLHTGVLTSFQERVPDGAAEGLYDD